jgi:hypothetical protein
MASGSACASFSASCLSAETTWSRTRCSSAGVTGCEGVALAGSFTLAVPPDGVKTGGLLTRSRLRSSKMRSASSRTICVSKLSGRTTSPGTTAMSSMGFT